jgi:hypothetical protein
MILGDDAYVSRGTRVYAFPIKGCTPSSVLGLCAPSWSTDLGSIPTTPVGFGSQIVVALANGTLVVLNGDGSVAWQATTTSTNPQIARRRHAARSSP